MTTQENENFYRHSTVIVDVSKDSFLHLLEFYLTGKDITIHSFIRINQHEIYHMCYNRYPCCQCPSYMRPETRGSRVLQKQQLDILLDPGGEKLPVHNLRSKSAPHCCSPVNHRLQLDHLDFTLARLLLVSFTSIVPNDSIERNALDNLVKIRNESFAHAKEGRIPNDEYKKSMVEIENSLLVLAKMYGKETETKQRLYDIAKHPLNSTICLQLQNTLLQQCQIDETLKKLLSENKLPDCLNKDVYDITVTEGCDAHFEIWTKEYWLLSVWFIDEMEIVRSEKFKPGISGKIHSLDIKNTCLSDKGVYIVRVKDIERQARLDVEAYFTKNLQRVECIEGETAEFTCEVIENSLHARWNKNGIHLENNEKYEILQAGKIHRLSIKNCDQHDTANYTVIINNRVRATSLFVIDYFTKSLERNVDCIEGDMVDLSCEVLEVDATAKWVKECIVLQNCDQFNIKLLGKIHILSIIQAKLQDAGVYTVIINSRLRSTTLHIKEYFTKSLDIITCIEGENVHFECEVLEDNQTSLWFKNGTELQTSDKYKVEIDGKLHRLVVNNTNLDDQGEYSVKIINCVRSSKLVVQANPAAFRQLSDKEKDLYLEIIKSGSEIRFYIRVVIIGENGVGKTCLLRRLLGKSIDDVESTDGIDVHRCKIRQDDGQWVVDKVTNLKKDMMTRLKMALKENANKRDALPVNDKTHKVLSVNTANIEHTVNSRSSNADSSEDKQSQSGTKKDKRQIKRESKDNARNNNETSSPETFDSRLGNIDALTLPVDEFHKSLGKSKQIQMSEKKIEPRLDRILTATILNELSQFIDDIEKYGIQNEVLVDCGIWDFSGQKHYYPTHPIFLNPNAVYLLVADIIKDVKQINTETGYDKIGEYIDFWFDSIHSCGDIATTKKSTEDYLNPPIIVVCSGIDKCRDQLLERKNEFRKQLLSLLRNENKQKHLRRICYVSNTEPSDQDFDNLRKSIFEFGKNIESYGKELPLRWNRLEQALDIVRGAGVNLLSWSDMTDLASKCSIEDEPEVGLFLKYHHQVGSIIYFESLKENIILNPKWLADAFRCFVSDKYDDDLKLTPEWKTLEDTGELKPSLIAKLFHKEPEREFYKHETLLLNVMEMFGVIVKLESCMEDEQKQSVWTYYMPCMISEKTSIMKICDLFSVNSCTQTPWLCIQFDFMPFDFFNHIFCHYIRKYAVCTESLSGGNALYHGMGVFFLDNTKTRKFILCFSKNAIAMQIWQWRKLEQGVCKSMLEELRSVIHTVKDKYEARRITCYEKTKCANGNVHIPVGRYSYKELTDLGDEEFFCEEHNGMHNTEDFFHTWFEEYSEENVHNPRHENFESTSKESTVEEEETTHVVTATSLNHSPPIITVDKVPFDVGIIYTRLQDEKNIKQGIQDKRFKLKCLVCDKKPSVYWCHNCQRSMCEDCNNQQSESDDTGFHILQHVQDRYSLDYNFKVNVRKIQDIKVLNDGVLVIADYIGQQLVTCDLTGKHQHTIPLPGGPWRIAVVDKNTVALTLYMSTPPAVVIVDVKQRQVKQHIDVEVWCRGIMYRDNQLFAGCVDQTIKVMNMSGEVTQTIPVGVTPYYFCGGEAGRIYYTDYALYCIDTVGNTLFTFTDPNMTYPYGITTDDEGHVLVICYKSNNVLRISPDGKQSQVIIKKIPRYGLHSYICYNSKSVVIGCNNDVYVYKKV